MSFLVFYKEEEEGSCSWLQLADHTVWNPAARALDKEMIVGLLKAAVVETLVTSLRSRCRSNSQATMQEETQAASAKGRYSPAHRTLPCRP